MQGMLEIPAVDFAYADKIGSQKCSRGHTGLCPYNNKNFKQFFSFMHKYKNANNIYIALPDESVQCIVVKLVVSVIMSVSSGSKL